MVGTGSERSVEAVSSAQVVSRGAVATESSLPICEGEPCEVPFPSMGLGWNRPCLFAVLGVLCGVMCFVWSKDHQLVHVFGC